MGKNDLLKFATQIIQQHDATHNVLIDVLIKLYVDACQQTHGVVCYPGFSEELWMAINAIEVETLVPDPAARLIVNIIKRTQVWMKEDEDAKGVNIIPVTEFIQSLENMKLLKSKLAEINRDDATQVPGETTVTGRQD